MQTIQFNNCERLSIAKHLADLGGMLVWGHPFFVCFFFGGEKKSIIIVFIYFFLFFDKQQQ